MKFRIGDYVSFKAGDYVSIIMPNHSTPIAIIIETNSTISRIQYLDSDKAIYSIANTSLLLATEEDAAIYVLENLTDKRG